MSKYRTNLPQLSDQLFLTDGGLETTLIFHESVDLPHFASFDLMKSKTGIAKLRAYYARYITMAKEYGLGFVLEAHTWRANRDWAAKLGYSRLELAKANRAAIALLADLRRHYEAPPPDLLREVTALGELRERLRRAIAQEEFEEAAQLRDQIRGME